MMDPEAEAPVILFVDDEATAVKYFQRAIGSLAPVVTAGSVEDGIAMINRHAASLAVLVSDQRMPGRFGNELLRYAREHHPHMVRILTTAYSEIEYTVEAINEGQIHRYIKKPWEISALRMELKLALEFSELRRERDQLLLEKMMVRQRQTVANRIGLLQLLCVGVLGPAHAGTLASYLSIASKVGVANPEPDWARMDYVDLVAAEAARSAAFTSQVLAVLAELRSGHSSVPGPASLHILATLLEGQAGVAIEGMLLVPAGLVTEFLAGASEGRVSEGHVRWLAFQAWMFTAGWALHGLSTDAGVECRLVPADQRFSDVPLAAWIEQF